MLNNNLFLSRLNSPCSVLIHCINFHSKTILWPDVRYTYWASIHDIEINCTGCKLWDSTNIFLSDFCSQFSLLMVSITRGHISKREVSWKPDSLTVGHLSAKVTLNHSHTILLGDELPPLPRG